jgi:hypothetical protein
MQKGQGQEPEYQIGEWGGETHYQCSLCPFDTFDGMEMLNHLVYQHESETALETLVQLETPTEVDDGENNVSKNGGKGPIPEPAG